MEPGKSFDGTAWGPWAIVKDDPVFHGEGNSDTGESFPPAPDLDHANDRVRRELTAWLNWLKNSVGFVGWRFDYAKGYGASFVKEYVDNTVGGGAMNVAEFLARGELGARRTARVGSEPDAAEHVRLAGPRESVHGGV